MGLSSRGIAKTKSFRRDGTDNIACTAASAHDTETEMAEGAESRRVEFQRSPLVKVASTHGTIGLSRGTKEAESFRPSHTCDFECAAQIPHTAEAEMSAGAEKFQPQTWVQRGK